jgi:hypothetical protein
MTDIFSSGSESCLAFYQASVSTIFGLYFQRADITW